MLGPAMRTVPAPSPRASLAWFIATGCTAAGVHWLVVVALVGLRQWPPLLANVMGWLCAFGVSFCGHHHLSFRRHGAPLGRSAVRFFAISAAGFCINELGYALLLAWAPQHYRLNLAALLLGVATLTYLLSRHWAFLHSPAG